MATDDHAGLRGACARCEIEVFVKTPALHNSIRARLFQDKRKAGSHGRALLEDVPAAGLLKGDRLEPGNDLPDVFQFDQRVPPFTCTFWRPALETRCHHRNPLWNLEVGCTPEHCLTIDWQHDCSLGVFQTYLGCLMHRLLELNAWGLLTQQLMRGQQRLCSR